MRGEILYPILSATFYYLGSRAVITSAIWSRYPRWLDKFMSCAACSGSWYTLLIAAFFGYVKSFTFFGMPGDSPITLITCLFYGTLTTPLLAYAHDYALYNLGSPVDDGEKK